MLLSLVQPHGKCLVEVNAAKSFDQELNQKRPYFFRLRLQYLHVLSKWEQFFVLLWCIKKRTVCVLVWLKWPKSHCRSNPEGASCSPPSRRPHLSISLSHTFTVRWGTRMRIFRIYTFFNFGQNAHIKAFNSFGSIVSSRAFSLPPLVKKRDRLRPAWSHVTSQARKQPGLSSYAPMVAECFRRGPQTGTS